MQFVPGPDFPTGGLIYGVEGIRQAYLTGRGRILMRARTEVKKLGKGDREQIVVTEIPYQVNKANMVAKIAELIREKRIEGVSNVEDHSDRDAHVPSGASNDLHCSVDVICIEIGQLDLSDFLQLCGGNLTDFFLVRFVGTSFDFGGFFD